MGIEAFKTIIMIIGAFAAIALVGLILVQQGKGADAGAAFGSGSAQGVFGSAGSANFLSRSTAISAAIFFACCLALSYISTHGNKSQLDFSNVNTTQNNTTASAPIASVPQSASSVIPE